MAKTPRAHATGILNEFTRKTSTGKRESIHKIKTLKREAYGFRDETFFILERYSLHQSKAVPTGI